MAEIGSNADIKELLECMDATEMDGFRTALASVLLEDTDMDTDTIYSLVFHDGREIIWC
jgi:hypothetical protein